MRLVRLCPLLLSAVAFLACLRQSPAQMSQAISLHGQFDASTFPGIDICAKTNAAVETAFAAMKQPNIDGMANLRGRIRIAAGNYTCNTAIHLPARCLDRRRW